MQRPALVALSLLIILVVSCSVPSVHSSSLNYTVHDEKVSVGLSLQFFQNATAMPNLNGTFTGSTAQDLTSALEETLRQSISSISVSSLSGELTSRNGWINTTIQFEVTGVSTRKGDLVIVNCSWIPFNVSRDLRFGDLSYNLIGAAYVRAPFESYVDYDKPPLNETIASVTYVSGLEEISPRVAVDKAGNATLLDFSNLVQSIEEWKSGYNVTKGSTTWTYDPSPAVDLTMTVVPREGTESVNHALYRYNATISVDRLARAQANALSIDVSSAFEPLLMFAVILATFTVAVAASWSYRSRRKQMIRRRK